MWREPGDGDTWPQHHRAQEPRIPKLLRKKLTPPPSPKPAPDPYWGVGSCYWESPQGT